VHHIKGSSPVNGRVFLNSVGLALSTAGICVAVLIGGRGFAAGRSTLAMLGVAMTLLVAVAFAAAFASGLRRGTGPDLRLVAAGWVLVLGHALLDLLRF
jgi:hypothetical protein